MSEDVAEKKFPLWVKMLIIIASLPVVMLPVIINDCNPVRYEEIKLFLILYPCYVLASAIMAWISYRNRPEITAILILLMLLTHMAMWFLPTAS